MKNLLIIIVVMALFNSLIAMFCLDRLDRIITDKNEIPKQPPWTFGKDGNLKSND